MGNTKKKRIINVVLIAAVSIIAVTVLGIAFLALTKSYMCDTCKKVILDTYVTDEKW